MSAAATVVKEVIKKANPKNLTRNAKRKLKRLERRDKELKKKETKPTLEEPKVAATTTEATEPTATAPATPAETAPPKRIHPPKYNLFDVLWHAGQSIGTKVTRSIWHRPECYWTITQVKWKPSQPGQHKYGKAWGILTWRGKTEARPTRVKCPLKKQWHLYDPNFYKKFQDKNYIQNQQWSGGSVPNMTQPEHMRQLNLPQ